MRLPKGFRQNAKETFTCDICGHTLDRHIFNKIMHGCVVRGCQCIGSGVFAPPVPPDISETVQKRSIRQPRAPWD